MAVPILTNRPREGRAATADGPKRREWPVLQAGDRTDGIEAIQNGVLGSRLLERPQFGHGLTAIRDHERSTLPNALEVPAEPGLQFAGTDRGVSCHVVMMTTSGLQVNQRRSPDGVPVSNRRAQRRCR
jgi:hypothetical protein